MKKLFSIFTLVGMLLVSMTACESEEPTASSVDEINGTISTLLPMSKAQVNAVTSADENVGESAVQDKTFTIKLETPSKTFDIREEIPNELKIDKDNVRGITFKNLEIVVGDDVKTLFCGDFDTSIKDLSMNADIDLKVATFVYVATDVVISGEVEVDTTDDLFDIEMLGIDLLDTSTLTKVDLDLKQGWNILDLHITVSKTSQGVESTVIIKNINKIPASYKWRIVGEI